MGYITWWLGLTQLGEGHGGEILPDASVDAYFGVHGWGVFDTLLTRGDTVPDEVCRVGLLRNTLESGDVRRYTEDTNTGT